LHCFCVNQELAPKLLGFKKLTGGWIAVAMEKVDTVEVHELQKSKFLSQLDTWKKEIEGLVEGFHEQGFVHGDLRLANFIFTNTNPPKMLLVDFNWRGMLSRNECRRHK
jgi:tRNA A-37 threonylcarbamoyl transferase component Bud32